MTLNGMKIQLSGAKKIKSLLEQIRLGEFWMKAHYICGHRNRKHDQTTT